MCFFQSFYLTSINIFQSEENIKHRNLRLYWLIYKELIIIIRILVCYVDKGAL